MATRWWLCVCSLGILLLVPSALSEVFYLAGSTHPVVGVFGQDAMLPCQLSPPARVPNMDVLWRKIDAGLTVVHEYLDEGSKDQPAKGFQNQTELFLQEFSSGNVSLKLKNLRVADAGKYQCLVKNPDWTQEVVTELRVTAVAPVFIDVLGPQGQGIRLACQSAGWYPKPKVQWVGKNSKNLTTETEAAVTQDGESLYSVESHITITKWENGGDVSCIVRNGLVETQQQSAIRLSGDIFPQASPWLAAFWVLFTLVLIAGGACAYLAYTGKQKAFKKKRSEEEALMKTETEKKTLEAECQELQKLLCAQRMTLESECQELCQKLEAQDKEKEALQLECQRLNSIIESWEKKEKEKQEKKKKKKEDEKKKKEEEEKKKKEQEQEKKEKEKQEKKMKEEEERRKKEEEKKKKEEEEKKKEQEKKMKEEEERRKKEEEKKKKEQEKKMKEAEEKKKKKPKEK